MSAVELTEILRAIGYVNTVLSTKPRGLSLAVKENAHLFSKHSTFFAFRRRNKC